MKKTISTPMAIIIVFLFTLLLGGAMVYQYGLLFKEISTYPDVPSFVPGKTVVITTDKTEYEQGEMIKITAKNDLDKSIWYIGNLPSEYSWWNLERKQNGTWKEVYILRPLIENGNKECVLILYEQMPIEELITELKTNSEVVDEWDLKNCYQSEIGPELELKFIEPGTYRFSFSYTPDKEIYLTERYSEAKIIYSDEFTIKAAASSKIIKRSVPQGDFVYDERTPTEACNSLIENIQNSNPSLNCELVDSKRIDAGVSDAKIIEKECVDGASVAGCFSCTFECK